MSWLLLLSPLRTLTQPLYRVSSFFIFVVVFFTNLHSFTVRRDVLGIGALLEGLPVVGPVLTPLVDALGLGPDHSKAESMVALDPNSDKAQQLQKIQEAVAQVSQAITSALPNVSAILPVQPPVSVPIPPSAPAPVAAPEVPAAVPAPSNVTDKIPGAVASKIPTGVTSKLPTAVTGALPTLPVAAIGDTSSTGSTTLASTQSSSSTMPSMVAAIGGTSDAAPTSASTEVSPSAMSSAASAVELS